MCMDGCEACNKGSMPRVGTDGTDWGCLDLARAALGPLPALAPPPVRIASLYRPVHSRDL